MSVRVVGAIALLGAAVLLWLSISARMQAVDLEHRGVEVDWEKRSYDPADEGDRVKMKIKETSLIGEQCFVGALVLAVAGVMFIIGGTGFRFLRPKEP